VTRLPHLTGADLIAALAAAGFTVVRVKGSHRFLRHADGPTLWWQPMPARRWAPGSWRRSSAMATSQQKHDAGSCDGVLDSLLFLQQRPGSDAGDSRAMLRRGPR